MNKLFTKIADVFLGLAMAVGVGVAASQVGAKVAEVKAAEEAFATCDFTTKAASSQSYIKSFAYDGYTVYGGANNQGTWAYMKFGAKKSKASAPTNVTDNYVRSPQLSEDITKIGIQIAQSNIGSEGIVTWGVDVCSDADFTNNVATVSLTTLAHKKAGTYYLTPSNGTSWGSNLYYQVNLHVENTTTTNGVAWVEKVIFYYNHLETQIITASADSAYVGHDINLTTNATSASWAMTANTAGASLSADSGQTITVSATQAGSVTVQATADGYTTVTKTLTFNAFPNVPFVTVVGEITGVYTGESLDLEFKCGSLDGELSVESSNTSVVTAGDAIEVAGEGLVSLDFVGVGDATLSFKDGSNVLATCDVTVLQSQINSITLNKNSLSLAPTESETLVATINKVGTASSAVAWSSDATDVATVNSGGTVTAVAVGTATITATAADGKTAECEVTVATSATYDFTTIDFTDGWSSSYAEHIINYSDGTSVTFAAASHQVSTINNMPVTKGNDVVVVFAASRKITSLSFVCAQWGSKAQTVTLHTSLNLGETFTNTEIKSSDFTLSTTLDAQVNSLKFTFSSTSNQVGISSLTVNYADSQAEVFKNNFMKMNQYVDDDSYDADRCTANYSAAKTAFNAMAEEQRTIFVSNTTYADAKARLVCWAAANGEALNVSNQFAKAANITLNSVFSSKSNNTALIIVASLTALSTVGGYFLIRRRKEN